MSTFFTIAITLFLVIDSFGNIPSYLNLLKPIEKERRRKIVLREQIFALLIMFVFCFVGPWLLTLLGVSQTTVNISGGIILFLIAIRLIFPTEEEAKWEVKEPFIVPIATPMIAGPSVLTVIMFFAQEETGKVQLLGSVFLAWLISSFVFYCARPIFRLIKETGLEACQRLMGLIVALIAVQKFLEGVESLIK